MGKTQTDYVDGLKTLCSLGLTLQQAKVYLTLAKIGQASVTEASAAADIDRGECHRIVHQLIEKRLISKVLTSPVKYEAVLLNTGITDLLEKKKKEVSSLENNVEKMLKTIKTKNNSVIEGVEKSIRFAPIGPTAVENMNRQLASVVKSFDAIMDTEWFESTQRFFYEGNKIGVKRGVKYRMLISDSKAKFNIKRFSGYIKETGFDIRTTTKAIAAPMVIFDKKTACILFSEENKIFKTSALVTNNESMLKLVQFYFDSLWKSSKKIEWTEELN